MTLIGARPQFIKASMLSRAFLKAGISEALVHSGQHYDKRISQIFFDELELPTPVANLHVGSGSHASQTARIMIGLDEFIAESSPFDFVILFGDTNTTIAGAIVAAKIGIPIVHVEAGLRSFNLEMPEEVNRIVTDRLSKLLFCPTKSAIDNLLDEGVKEGVFLAGDVMYDATIHFSSMADRNLKKNLADALNAREYFLTTIHRASNTNNRDRLASILDSLGNLDLPVLFPIHPRTRESIKDLKLSENIKIMKPAGYLEMLSLIKTAKAVITDSGGLQKEAYWLKVPCITLRQQTEWTETLQGNWNQLVGADPNLLYQAVSNLLNPRGEYKPFGLAENGSFATEFITSTLEKINSV